MYSVKKNQSAYWWNQVLNHKDKWEVMKKSEIELDGKKIFAGRVEPDLDVCLSQAARTGDFDRLRWAGLWIDGNSQVRRVRSSTEFPPLIREP